MIGFMMMRKNGLGQFLQIRRKRTQFRINMSSLCREWVAHLCFLREEVFYYVFQFTCYVVNFFFLFNFFHFDHIWWKDVFFCLSHLTSCVTVINSTRSTRGLVLTYDMQNSSSFCVIFIVTIDRERGYSVWCLESLGVQYGEFKKAAYNVEFRKTQWH